MGSKGEATRSRLIIGARELIETHGYSGTGLNQVLAVSGAPRGSLYFHFPGGKDELVAAAIEESGAEVGALIEEAADRAPDARGAVLGLLDAFAARLEESDFTRGCPLAATALDSAAADDTVRESCRRVYTSWQRALARLLAAEGRATAEADAWSVLSLVEGALLLSRSTRTLAPLHHAREAVTRLLTGP
ncbi:TetR family transcriptional regulator [Nocardiopsis sp. TSRI0078]|uniref:TetR/AcrR family transcriptional regulator n=1 Tax=unclassified Nocardiopsis TaxID=2649073 RepID=UPI00093F9803|nr:TetR/AcrR family transcriptional regulator [Nocardiopsis sp. TSRI0078]OKI22417.1 TetR family transcriptional regulator [Nocardiopsis sp. TSRI0078]